jgi:hypothetical protein
MTYLKKGFLERGQKNSPGRNLRVVLIAVDQYLYAVKGEQGCIIIFQPGVNQHADSSQVASSVDTKGNAVPVGKLE